MPRRLLFGFALLAIAVLVGCGSPAPAAENSGPANAPPRNATFDDIKLDLKKGDPYSRKALTDKVKELDGKQIQIRGFILPSFQESGIKQFVLVRDNMECCFGPGAALFDCILVEMQGAATANFTTRPVKVEGKFTVQEVLDPVSNQPLAIYHLDAKEVK